MNVGMLWFDDSRDVLPAKIQKAAEYYFKKHGRMPNLCLVHPNMLQEKVEIAGLVVRPYRPVLPGHIWIIEEMPVSPEMKRHFPVRTDTRPGKPTHYVARCGYESDKKDEFVIPWNYKPEQVTCEGCLENKA